MKLQLFNVNDSPNTINKQKELLVDTTVVLPNNIDIDYLTLKIIIENLPDVNYCHIEQLGYYFINEINTTGNYHVLSCRPDLLETYKDIILTSEAVITFSNNPSYAQTSKNYDVRKTVDTYQSTSKIPYDPKIIVTVI